MYSLLALALIPAALAQNFYGCYTESTPPHALSGAVFYDLTIPQCGAACTAAGYSLYGLEYGRECYCGNSLAAGCVPTFADQCNMVCGADNTTICGGNSRMSIYGTSATPPVVTDASHPPVTTAVALGCYTEGNGTRALPSDALVDDGMTVEACSSYCLTRGFVLYGVEYMRECYCANAQDPSSLAAPATDCNMPCAGNAAETCGGASRLNVYQWQ
ncbi:WSC-domain-containing protein [Thozetella sp. PMI_491]|nr:WSC-domain-containing protein [Thozetella sp. PMI_491]